MDFLIAIENGDVNYIPTNDDYFSTKEIIDSLIIAGKYANMNINGTPILSDDANKYRMELIDQHVDVTSHNNGETSLHIAVQYNDIKIVKSLILKGADVNAVDNNGNTPLHLAIIYERVEIVELLLSNGADVNIKPKYTHSLLSLTKCHVIRNLLK